MNGYSRAQIALHWMVAILIAASWFTGEDMGPALRALAAGGTVGTPPHVSIGLIVFGLVAIRLVLRLVQGAPQPAAGTPPLAAKAAHWGHRILYALMIVVPLAGISTWYLGVRALGEVHEVLGNALMIVALGHAGAAFWHQYVQRDDTLTRMLRPAR